MPTRRRQDDHPILIRLNVAIENMRWYFFKVESLCETRATSLGNKVIPIFFHCLIIHSFVNT